jgi:Na+/melibiose symporter-like transporter
VVIFKTKSRESINSKTKKESSMKRLSKSFSRMSMASSLNSKPMKIFDWFKEPQFYLVACIYMSARLFVNVSQSYITFYVQYTVTLSSDMIAVIPLVMYVAGFFISLLLKFLTDRFGYKIAFVLSCIVGLSTLNFVYIYF